MITKNQARKRFLTIPPVLQQAIFSVQNAEIIARVAEENHLNDSRSAKLSEGVGWVLLGFMHPEDLAKELQEEASIPAQTATAIAGSIASKIFNPFKTTLDQTYAPLPIENDRGLAPKIIQDIGPIASIPPQAPASTQKFTTPLAVSMKPVQAAPPPLPPMPSPSLTDKGWSKISPNDPVIQFAPSKTNPPVPKTVTSFTPPTPPAATSRPSMPTSNSAGEFARFNNTPSIPKPPSPTASAAPAGPAPMMLHEDPQIKSIQGGSDFHISMPARDANVIGDSKSSAPSRPAVIEFGKAAASAPTAKVVHYTEFKPSMSVPPQAGGAGRNVMEITGAPASPAAQKSSGFTSIPVPIPPMPKPATASIVPPPPQVPKPPTPPATSAKVINKDY